MVYNQNFIDNLVNLLVNRTREGYCYIPIQSSIDVSHRIKISDSIEAILIIEGGFSPTKNKQGTHNVSHHVFHYINILKLDSVQNAIGGLSEHNTHNISISADQYDLITKEYDKYIEGDVFSPDEVLSEIKNIIRKEKIDTHI